MKNILAAIIIILTSVSSVVADLMTIEGDFACTPSGQGFGNVGEFSGSFSFKFDFDSITGSTFEKVSDIPLSSLSVFPSPINGIVYDKNNTLATVIFKNSNLEIFWIGGATYGVPLCSSGTDDFSIQFRGSNNSFDAYNAHVVTSNDTGVGSDTTPVGTATVIPEPSGILLIAVSGSIMVFIRRRFWR